MLLGRYKQQTGERRKRGIDFDRFLEDGEIITDVDTAVTPATDTPLVVDDVTIDSDGRDFVYFVSGGEDNTEYTIEFSVATSGGQTLENEVEIEVEDV